MTHHLRPHRLLSGALLGALVATMDLTLAFGVPELWPQWWTRSRAWLAQRRFPVGGGPLASQPLHLEVTPVASVAALGPVLAMLRQQAGVQEVELAQVATGTALVHVQASEMTHLVAALLQLRGDTMARLTLLDAHRLRITMVAPEARSAA
jgi:hypothetical protein